jgi:predicted lipoprotein with Yx(FWY)xxD motif
LDDFTIVVRDDGGKQWAHRGLPLYRWVKDEKPGDTTGHRFKNVWTVAQP